MAVSGKKTVTAAGTAEALGEQKVNGALMVKALIANTANIYLGDHSVSSSSGLELAAGDAVVFDFVGDLGTIYVDAAVNGEGVAWLMLEA